MRAFEAGFDWKNKLLFAEHHQSHAASAFFPSPYQDAVVLTMDEPVLAARLVAKLRKAYPQLLIVARARDTGHAAELYRAGASHAVPETLESSLQLSEAVLVDIGVPMGPVIASIHEQRDEYRVKIEQEGALAYKPKLRTSTSDA